MGQDDVAVEPSWPSPRSGRPSRGSGAVARPPSRRLAAATVLVLLLGAVLALAGPGGREAATADPTTPGAVRLDTDWVRVADPGDTGVEQGLHTGLTPGGVAVTVPNVSDPTTSDASYAGSVWWYSRRVSVPAARSGAGWALRFEGVRRTSTVYVDGQAVAQNDDPYAPFEAELPAGSAGRTVTVAVRVDGRRPRVSEGWWNWNGITRPVWLVPRGRLHAADPAVQGQAACTGPDVCATSVRVRADVRNRTGDALPGRVRVTVRDAAGAMVATTEQDLGTVAPGGQAAAAVDLPVPDGRLWSPSTPVLYAATVQVLSGAGRVEQEVRRDVGLRSVTAQDGRLQLNGHDLRLRGASIQEDVPEHGAALTDGDVARMLGELQASGANVTRAHYTLDERLLSALDRAGIMVWEQAPVYQSTTALGRDDARAEALERNVRAVVATRNHPAVIVHSVANELSPVVDRHPGAVAYLARARTDVQALDPTVPPAIDLVNYPGYARQRAYRAFPVLGLNTYFGWYDGRRGHETRRFEDFAPFLDRLRRQYPTQAMAITEMGAEGIRRGPATRKGSYEFQTRYFRRLMNVIDARDDLSGALYWTLREFAVKPGWTGGVAPEHAKRGGIHRKGLLTYAGRPKPVWNVARARLDGSVWAPDAPVRTAYGH
jgi:hypothetical protein